jgi:hypothetical protein
MDMQFRSARGIRGDTQSKAHCRSSGATSRSQAPSMSMARPHGGDGTAPLRMRKTGTDAGHETPQFMPKIIILPREGGPMEVPAQVSNFHHPRGGMWAPMQLGLETQIINAQRYLDWLNTFLISGLLRGAE